MNCTDRLIAFTDLDGTLLDHSTYQWEPARPALDALRLRGDGVVLSSSKTAPEIAVLRSELGLEQWPAIVENGAGLLPEKALHLGASPVHYKEIISSIQSLPHKLGNLFRGFGQCTAEQVAKMTGLSSAAAVLAKERAFSEPGLWEGTDVQKSEFLDLLREKGIHAQQGGRFLTLSFGGNKADQMRNIIEAYKPARTIALGDAPNDIEMLELADLGVIVANPDRSPLPPLKGEKEGRIIRTQAAGPEGWNTAILKILARPDVK